MVEVRGPSGPSLETSDVGAWFRGSSLALLAPQPPMKRVAGQPDQDVHLVLEAVGQRVDRPPPDVERLLARRMAYAGRGAGREPDVEVVDVAAGVAEADDVLVEVDRLGVEVEVGDARLLPRLAQRRAAARVASPGSRWPPKANQRRALRCRFSSTSSPVADSTSVPAVRWSGKQDRRSPSACASRCAT